MFIQGFNSPVTVGEDEVRQALEAWFNAKLMPNAQVSATGIKMTKQIVTVWFKPRATK